MWARRGHSPAPTLAVSHTSALCVVTTSTSAAAASGSSARDACGCRRLLPLDRVRLGRAGVYDAGQGAQSDARDHRQRDLVDHLTPWLATLVAPRMRGRPLLGLRRASGVTHPRWAWVAGAARGMESEAGEKQCRGDRHRTISAEPRPALLASRGRESRRLRRRGRYWIAVHRAPLHEAVGLTRRHAGRAGAGAGARPRSSDPRAPVPAPDTSARPPPSTRRHQGAGG